MACHLFAVVNGLTDKQLNCLLLAKIDGYPANQVALLELMEVDRVVKQQQSLIMEATESETGHVFLDSTHLCKLTVEVGTVLLTLSISDVDKERKDTNIDPLVLTKTTRENLRLVALSLSLGAPVLLYGPNSSGKSHMIRHLAHVCNKKLITLHMTDQTDVKSLLGIYSCTGPGEFEFHLGVLSKAVHHGHWLLIEDIEMAPPDLIAVLTSIINRRSVEVGSGRGEKIHCGRGFQLFATLSTETTAITERMGCQNGWNASRWTRIYVSRPAINEVAEIVGRRFPFFSVDIISWIIGTYESICRWTKDMSKSSSRVRDFSIRDLIKWCKRVSVRQTNG